jgi:hypothetical protein
MPSPLDIIIRFLLPLLLLGMALVILRINSAEEKWTVKQLALAAVFLVFLGVWLFQNIGAITPATPSAGSSPQGGNVVEKMNVSRASALAVDALPAGPNGKRNAEAYASGGLVIASTSFDGERWNVLFSRRYPSGMMGIPYSLTVSIDAKNGVVLGFSEAQ